MGPSIRVRGKAIRSRRIWTAGWGYSKAIRGRDGSANQVQATKQNGTAPFSKLFFIFLFTNKCESSIILRTYYYTTHKKNDVIEASIFNSDVDHYTLIKYFSCKILMLLFLCWNLYYASVNSRSKFIHFDSTCSYFLKFANRGSNIIDGATPSVLYIN